MIIYVVCLSPFFSAVHLACVPANEQQGIRNEHSTLHNQQQNSPDDRLHSWNHVRYILPAIPQYRFFDESVFGYQSIKDFTLTQSQPFDVVDFDLLVPDSIGKDPYIHIYSFDLIRDSIISNPEFMKYKSEWIENLGNGTFNALAQLVWKSEKFKRRFPELDISVVTQKNYTVLKNGNDRLTYLMCVGSEDSPQVVAYTSIIHINGTVIFFKAWLSSASSVDDVIHTTVIAESYVASFLARNVRTPTY